MACPFGKARVPPLEIPRLHHPGDAIEVVQIVVVELAVGVVPQLEVGAHVRLVEVEDFQRLFEERREDVHGAAEELGERRGVVGDVHPDEAAEAHLAAHLAQRRVLLAEAVLVALLAARDLDARPARVERPLVEDARHALGIARRIVEQRVAAVRADVVERAHLVVVAAHGDERHARRVGEQAVVKGCGYLRLVARDDPRAPEELFLLLLEDLGVRIDPRVDVVGRGELGPGLPLLAVLAHDARSPISCSRSCTAPLSSRGGRRP